ncbi:MAG: hypothetical protein ABIR04_11370, partial [Cypionkella sp.]
MVSRSDPPPENRAVLFLSSNGIGLGHLSRQLAIATRLPPKLEPVFHSQSLGIRLAREAGFLTFHHQHHRYNGLDVEIWNCQLGRDLVMLARHLRPAAIVVDCTVIFGGFMRVLEETKGQIPRIWIRRGFLAPEHSRHLAATDCFDYVIEPGDLAAALDDGPSAALRDQVITVPPVLNVAPEERLSREEARSRLGLSDDRPTIALLLGHTLGAATAAIRQTICTALAATNACLLDIRSPLEADLSEASGGARRLSLYPAFSLSHGFDAVITLAGYNSFHEAMLGKVPTLFLVWPQPGMDRQDRRVEWAVARGLALGLNGEPLANGEVTGLTEAVAE